MASSRATFRRAMLVTDPVGIVAGDVAVPFSSGRLAIGPIELMIAVSELGRGMRIDWSVHNAGRSPVTLDRVGIRFSMAPAPTQVLEHGYQSWSVVRRCRLDDIRPERAE